MILHVCLSTLATLTVKSSDFPVLDNQNANIHFIFDQMELDGLMEQLLDGTQWPESAKLTQVNATHVKKLEQNENRSQHQILQHPE